MKILFRRAFSKPLSESAFSIKCDEGNSHIQTGELLYFSPFPLPLFGVASIFPLPLRPLLALAPLNLVI